MSSTRSKADGDAIRELRIQQEMRIVDLAGKVGCHRKTIEYIERGRCGASEVMLQKIAVALGTDRKSLTQRKPNGRAA